MPVWELLGAVAAALTALGIIGGALGWLVWPRIEERFEQIARGIDRVERQTTGDQADTLSRHARVAAAAASEIPQLRQQLERIATKQNSLDTWQRNTDRRLGKLEEALIALMSNELRERIQDHEDFWP